MPNLFVTFVVARIFVALLMGWICFATPANRYEGKSHGGYTLKQVRR